MLFKKDIGGYQRLYSFLSQIIDYGNTCGREALPVLSPPDAATRIRPGAGRPSTSSKVTLTHHALKTTGKTAAHHRRRRSAEASADRGSRVRGDQREGEGAPRRDHRAGQRALFEGELTDDDELVYVNSVIKGKLLESRGAGRASGQQHQGAVRRLADTLQGTPRTPSWTRYAAHTTMSKQALDSERVREGLKEVLLGPGQLYEALRERGGPAPG